MRTTIDVFFALVYSLTTGLLVVVSFKNNCEKFSKLLAF